MSDLFRVVDAVRKVYPDAFGDGSPWEFFVPDKPIRLCWTPADGRRGTPASYYLIWWPSSTLMPPLGERMINSCPERLVLVTYDAAWMLDVCRLAGIVR